jgi:ribosomal protein S18 acetylase RimI-like enzyme
VTTGPQIERMAALDDVAIDGLAALLADVVDGGNSVGFHAPLQHATALAYWREVAASLGADNMLWLAHDGDRRIVGSVQLQRAKRENGRHRGEVCKLIVRREARRAGVAARLMAALEAQALHCGLSLLALDTEARSPAEAFYRQQGWQRVGEIPGYASNTGGALRATALYFKTL